MTRGPPSALREQIRKARARPLGPRYTYVQPGRLLSSSVILWEDEPVQGLTYIDGVATGPRGRHANVRFFVDSGTWNYATREWTDQVGLKQAGATERK